MSCYPRAGGGETADVFGDEGQPLQPYGGALHLVVEGEALGRRPDPSLAAVEELQLGGALEVSQKPADRRLGDAQDFGRAGRGAAGDDGPEGLDLAEVHRNPTYITFLHNYRGS